MHVVFVCVTVLHMPRCLLGESDLGEGPRVVVRDVGAAQAVEAMAVVDAHNGVIRTD